MALINFLCVQQMYFSDVKKTGETDFVEKPKSIRGTPFGKGVVPKKWTSSNVTHFGREGHIYCVIYWLTLKKNMRVYVMMSVRPVIFDKSFALSFSSEAM